MEIRVGTIVYTKILSNNKIVETIGKVKEIDDDFAILEETYSSINGGDWFITHKILKTYDGEFIKNISPVNIDQYDMYMDAKQSKNE